MAKELYWMCIFVLCCVPMRVAQANQTDPHINNNTQYLINPSTEVPHELSLNNTTSSTQPLPTTTTTFALSTIDSSTSTISKPHGLATSFATQTPTTATTPAPRRDTCSGRQLLADQPIQSEYAQVTKCHWNETLRVEFVYAVFYEYCIDDLENATVLPDENFNPCEGAEHSRFVYGEEDGERLYVLQNGSLLRINANHTEYDVFQTYCLYADEATNATLAMVCYDHVVNVSRAQAYLYAICMLMSVPCLLVTAYLYLAIKKLRNLHGKSLAAHSICLAIGFLLLSIVEIRGAVGTKTGYVIQYFILACFMWIGVMCIDICSQVWYFIPRHIEMTATRSRNRFIFYAMLCQGIPVILVSLAIANNLDGRPSYFLKGITDATRSSQQFFIPPISTVLFMCFVLLIAAYFGFRRLDPIVNAAFFTQMELQRNNLKVNMESVDIVLYAETNMIARSTTFLYIIMAMNWIFEIISFYVPMSMSLFDIMNALQGIVIFIIFVSLKRPLNIIKSWWVDNGSVNTFELEQMNKPAEVSITVEKQPAPPQTPETDVRPTS